MTIDTLATGEGSVQEVTDMADQFLNGNYEITVGGDGEITVDTWLGDDDVDAFMDSLTQLGYQVEAT